MAISPLHDARDVVTYQILSDGTIIPDSVEVVSIKVEQQLYSVPQAIIEIALPQRDRDPFALSENAAFAPDKSITINAGYHSREATIFKGVVSGQGVSGNGSMTILTVYCEHEAAKMDINEQSATFSDKKNSEIIAQVCGENGIEIETDDSDQMYENVFQNKKTDWDFIVQRAFLSNLLIVCEDDKVLAKKKNLGAAADIKLTFGRDVNSFDLTLDQASQLGGGRSKSAKLKTKVHKDKRGQKTTPPTGTLEFQGSALARLNTPIELAGFGDNYKGKQLISGVHHSIAAGNWTTTVEIGLDILRYLGLEEEEASTANEGTQANEAPVLEYVTYDEDTETLTIKDPHQNEIVLSSDGISIKSESDLHLEAAGNILLNAGNKIDAQATGNLIGHGQQINLSSDTSFKATGLSTAELSATGTTTIKGAMVMIN